jgi:CBS domain-containing protein
MGLTAVLFNLPILNPITVLSGAVGFGVTAIFAYVFIYNIFLALFNLLPAFPMDGGRILRSLLAMRLDYAQATRIAASIGQGVAVLMGLYGLFNGGVFLALIAVFIFFAARQEAAAAVERSLLQGYTVQQAYSTSAHYLSPYTSLERAANLMLFSGQKDFPVCENGRLVGFLTHDRLMSALQQRGGHTWAVTVMDRNVRPVAPLTPLHKVQGRFLQEGVSALPVATEDGRYLGLISQRGLIDFRRLLENAPDAAPRVSSARL